MWAAGDDCRLWFGHWERKPLAASMTCGGDHLVTPPTGVEQAQRGDVVGAFYLLWTRPASNLANT